MKELKAINSGDLANYRLPRMKRMVSRSLDILGAALQQGRTGFSVSGGKDSTVGAYLLRVLDKDAPLGFFDSGCEYQQTYDLLREIGADFILPQRSLMEMLRVGGYWGYEGPEKTPGMTFDFRGFLVNEPSRQFVVKHKLDCVSIGLRMEESAGRRMLGKCHSLQYVKGQDCWQCYPLMQWTQEDIWAFIAGTGIPYNSIYDEMAKIGIPRNDWRVSCLMGMCGAAQGGRYCFLRQMCPDRWTQLCKEFPKIVEFT